MPTATGSLSLATAYIYRGQKDSWAVSARDRWTRFSVDSRTSKFTNKAQIAEWIADYGEDSDFVRVRVRGECPRVGSSQFIPSDVVAACRKFKVADATIKGLPKILAVDVARFGDDRSVIGSRQGRKARILAKFRGMDTVQLAERVIEPHRPAVRLQL